MSRSEPTSPPPHPLQFCWVLSYDGPSANTQKNSNWGAERMRLAKFSTVEEFWGVFNNILEPSKLVSPSTYYLFKDGINPEWEDPTNCNGGKWVMSTKDIKRMDVCWINSVLSIIGESFGADECDDISGLILQVKPPGKDHKLSLWTKTAKNMDLQTSIGTKWKEAMGEQKKIIMNLHKDSMASSRSYGGKVYLEV
mmetsp:Transcript_10592/g.19105  ORF Transcript_10592/g.19105 Transcript_10592/m.19105 type:complete len:196 (-) Transcript_10592:233-820(-)